MGQMLPLGRRERVCDLCVEVPAFALDSRSTASSTSRAIAISGLALSRLTTGLGDATEHLVIGPILLSIFGQEKGDPKAPWI